MTAPVRADFSHFTPLRVRYSEIDAQGVAFNAHYLTWFDCALNEHLRDIDFDYHAMVREQQLDFHLIKSSVEYLGPIHFDEIIEIGSRPARIGNTSLTWELGIFRQREDQCLSRGEIVWVCAKVGTHKSHALPEELVARLDARR